MTTATQYTHTDMPTVDWICAMQLDENESRPSKVEGKGTHSSDDVTRNSREPNDDDDGQSSISHQSSEASVKDALLLDPVPRQGWVSLTHT